MLQNQSDSSKRSKVIDSATHNANATLQKGSRTWIYVVTECQSMFKVLGFKSGTDAERYGDDLAVELFESGRGGFAGRPMSFPVGDARALVCLVETRDELDDDVRLRMGERGVGGR
mmetsp:Transcript_34789/g.84164  ORF Transcript_34789/g.84164 Transcript_34789/m.84164 type:complete len:116 (-) Transcript_34789:2254-2601(-)